MYGINEATIIASLTIPAGLFIDFSGKLLKEINYNNSPEKSINTR